MRILAESKAEMKIFMEIKIITPAKKLLSIILLENLEQAGTYVI